jgi:hypothetical protein
MKWSMRNHSRVSRAMSRLRVSIETFVETWSVLDDLERHRWFARYSVVVARDDELANWTWLQFVERETRRSRSTGEWKLHYRLPSWRAERDAVAFKATAIPGLADLIVSGLGRQKRSVLLFPNVHKIVEKMKKPINGQYHTIGDLPATRAWSFASAFDHAPDSAHHGLQLGQCGWISAAPKSRACHPQKGLGRFLLPHSTNFYGF